MCIRVAGTTVKELWRKLMQFHGFTCYCSTLCAQKRVALQAITASAKERARRETRRIKGPTDQSGRSKARRWLDRFDDRRQQS